MTALAELGTTPVWAQYVSLKRRYPNHLLLLRLGDFYESFSDDATNLAEALGIMLTSREMGKGRRVPMAGVPHHSLDGHLAKLIAAGHRIAVAEQLSDPAKSKGLVERDVTRVVTPGTVLEPGLLHDHRPNYIAAAVIDGARAGLAHAEITTGAFATTQLATSALANELQRLQPAEWLIPAPHGDDDATDLESAELPPILGVAATTCPARRFRLDDARNCLEQHFGISVLADAGCADQPLAIRAAGALLAYLQDTTPAAVAALEDLRVYTIGGFMTLDEPTRRNLEITETARTRKAQGSLIATLDATRTAMGARLLRGWLSQPLLEVEPLHERQIAIAWFVDHGLARDACRRALGKIGDLERLANRVIQRLATPRDLTSLKNSLQQAPTLVDAVAADRHTDGSSPKPAHTLPDCADLVALIDAALAPDPPATATEGNVIAAGYHAELDALRESTRGARDWIAGLEASERARTGIRGLKVGYNRVFGYYIELSHANRDAAPADYQRKQTLVNGERYVTPELKEQEARLLDAQERINELEHRVYRELVEQVAAAGTRLRRLADAVAHLDVVSALAHVADRWRWTRPDLDTGPEICIAEGRHPVLEHTGVTVIPNDCALGGANAQLAIITGPNMAGKSTYLRQVAVIVLLAQIGSFVPAASARIGLVDRIFTRVGAHDDLAAGQSTFMVEMTETANILRHATARSLLIFDEIGRGTSTYDGVAIARSVVEYVHNHPDLGCKTLFATHYHELADLERILPRVKNLRVEVHDENDEVVFLHQVVPGAADRSYGIHVARLAGVPRAVTRRAEEVLRELETGGWRRAAADANTGDRPESSVGPVGPRRRFRARRETHDLAQLTLFGEPDPIVEKLKSLDVLSLSPLEALSRLYELQEEAKAQGAL